MMITAGWAVVYSTNSSSPRAKRWYRVARIVQDGDKWYELHWHDSLTLRGRNRAEVRGNALGLGLDLFQGVFTDAPSPRRGNELVRR